VPALRRSLRLCRPLDLRLTVGPLVRGTGDPSLRVASTRLVRASRTPDGPAAIDLRLLGEVVQAEAWGPGAGFLVDTLPAFLGEDDDERGFEPRLHPLVAELARRRIGLRLGRTGAVWESLLPAILEQRITGTEAWRGFRRLIRSHGEPAPGPLGLLLAPAAATVAALPSWTFPQLGIEPRRGALLRRVAADAGRLEALAAPARVAGGGGAGSRELAARLRAYPGIGPWTAAEVTVRVLGDPDAVSVGDAHLPNLVAWALAGEPRGSDERMLELLAPWAGHRARVIRLLETSGLAAPRYGPRVAARDLAGL
jgi:3-methyladenine DNA glycosylase/8-oxoguanine DNA glycosylase